MDEELQRRFDAVERAQDEWREHRLTGYEFGYVGGGPTIGTATGQPFTPEWRERERELWATFQRAREEWLGYRPQESRPRSRQLDWSPSARYEIVVRPVAGGVGQDTTRHPGSAIRRST